MFNSLIFCTRFTCLHKHNDIFAQRSGFVSYPKYIILYPSLATCFVHISKAITGQYISLSVLSNFLLHKHICNYIDLHKLDIHDTV